MTIKEFAEKYGLPYHVAYEATYGVKTVSTRIRDRDFLEKDLFDATISTINYKVMRLQKRIGIQKDYYQRMMVVKKREMSKVRRESKDLRHPAQTGQHQLETEAL